MEHAGEQLALDLDLPRPRARGHARRTRLAWLALQTVVALAVGVLLAAVAVVVVPYRTSVAGVQITVTATAVPSKRGITVDSSVGSLQFRDVTALPLGLHVAPQVDLGTVRAVTGDDDFATTVRTDLTDRIPALAWHFGLAAVLGLVVGAALGLLLVAGARAVFTPTRGSPRPSRRRELRSLSLTVAATTVAVLVAAGVVGAASYDPDWTRQYAVTGLLADVAATPDRLAELDARDSGAAAKIRAVLRLQDALTAPASEATDADTAYSILFVSDIHRRNIYPYLAQYIAANDVALIVNTGDETLVGNTAELTADYVASISAVTTKTPMLWIKGNHDSAAVADRMATIPGVTVLDDQVVKAFGLQVYGVGDPRTYGAKGDAGKDDPATVTRVETAAAADALDQLDRSTYLDLLMAHEPVMADAMTTTLGPTVRAQASGHVHRQNAESDLQTDGRIRLVEGTTGLGGLLADAGDPMSFSVLSVATNCQFTRIVRYQLADPAIPDAGDATSFGENSSFVVHYFDRQDTSRDRECSFADGLGDPQPAAVSPAGAGLATLADWGPAGASVPTGTAVSTPATVSSDDESGDAGVTAETTGTGTGTGSVPGVGTAAGTAAGTTAGTAAGTPTGTP